MVNFIPVIDQQFPHQVNLFLPCFSKNSSFLISSTLSGYSRFFIGNSIFHLSLELLTKFWKTSLELAFTYLVL